MDTNLSRLCDSSLNPNAAYLLSTSRIENVLKQLIYGIDSREGLIVLTCEPDSSKMALIRALLDSLRQQDVAAVLISNPGPHAGDLYRKTLEASGAAFDSHRDDPLLALKKWLSRRSGAGSATALIVDRAEELSLEALEEVRMLLNLETPQEKMLQIILIGGPEFDERLRKPELYRLRQRIAVRCTTALLADHKADHDTEEAIADIPERFVAAAAAGGHSPDAISAIHAGTSVIPRFPDLPNAETPMNTTQVEIEPLAAPAVEEPALALQTECVKELRADPSSKHVEAPVVEGPALDLQIADNRAEVQPAGARPVRLAPDAPDESVVPTGSDVPSPDERPVMPAQRSSRPAIAAAIQWLQAPMDPVRSLRRWRSQLQSGYRAVSNPIERARVVNSVCGWLREPFDPIRWLQQSFRSKLREPEQ